MVAGRGIESNAAPVDIEGYIANATQASGLIAQSSDLLWKATASKADIDKKEAELKAANEIKDLKEQDAKLKQIQPDHETQLAAALNDKEKRAQLARAKGDKQKCINGVLYNFVLGFLKDVQVLEQSSSLVTNLIGNGKCFNRRFHELRCYVIAPLVSDIGNLPTTSTSNYEHGIKA